MKTRALVLILVGLLSVACAGRETQAPMPSSLNTAALTDLQNNALYAAGLDWFEASAGKFDLIGGGGEAVDVREHALATEYGHTDFGPVAIQFDGPRIESDADAFAADPAKLYRNVFAHEIGHVLGLGHKAGTLMDPTAAAWEPFDCIDADTLAAACANYGGCPAGAHSTCAEGGS